LIGHNANGRRHEVSELIDSPADPQDLVEEPEHVLEEVAQPPVVITEQELAFSTAAAVGLPRTKPTRRVIAALRAKFRSLSDGPPPAQRHCPPRFYGFFEDAAMEREMHRL
jgi:hypothetical protein